ncbi:YwqG family protein [Streptomyces sp. NBC_01754]|uniref:hypothetical protein n=1 Tax=Streptomyces sp. NBC_01754 TaxID=2975930 RepID=UPI002DD9DAF2|nr:hypothetical protein [Streptomyces sp. NBC_01754]WSC91841.1 YwqG family protein [Streptomyces sp. NBC_01754]
MRETVLDAGRTLGVPGPVTEALLRLLRPCVYLCPYDSLPEGLKQDARTVARAGGLPHLPEGMEPPLPVPHALTVDCAALPAGSLDIELPADGHLVVFADVTHCPSAGAVLHLPAGTETVEYHRQDGLCEEDDEEPEALEPYEPVPLYAVPGLTVPRPFGRAVVPEAVDHTAGDAERIRRVDQLVDRIEELLDVPYRHELQLGGHSNAWHNQAEDYGHVLLVRIPESSVSEGDLSLTLVTGTREQIAERRYDELDIAYEC